MFKLVKLNMNILFLCLYNRVDENSLQPMNAFRNLQMLLNSPAYIGNLLVWLLLLLLPLDTNLIFSNRGNYVQIPIELYTKTNEDIIYDLISRGGKQTGGAVDVIDESAEPVNENEYDFVENNIPDLNFTTTNVPEDSVSDGGRSMVSHSQCDNIDLTHSIFLPTCSLQL